MDEEERELFLGILEALADCQKQLLVTSTLAIALQNLLIENNVLSGKEVFNECKKGSKLVKKTLLDSWKERGMI